MDQAAQMIPTHFHKFFVDRLNSSHQPLDQEFRESQGEAHLLRSPPPTGTCTCTGTGTGTSSSRTTTNDCATSTKSTKHASTMLGLFLSLFIHFTPVTAFVVHRTPALQEARQINSRRDQSSFQLPIGENDSSQPFFASSSSSSSSSISANFTTSTSTDLSPEIQDWTNFMSKNAGSRKQQQRNHTETNGSKRANFSNNKIHFDPSNMTLDLTMTTPATTSVPSVPGTITARETGGSNAAVATTATTTSNSYQPLQPLTKAEEDQILQFWDELSPTLQYLPQRKHRQIYQALRVAYICHRGQMRKSGEPFIVHPVQVALLLSSLKMDTETIMAGLLHDTVEDTDLTFDQVEELFGPVVKNIVEGETKVSKLPKLAFHEQSAGNQATSNDPSAAASDESYDEQAENLRQMFVAMTEDYRIIIVKLADRLHNMRTLQHMKPDKQIKISRETLDIFAPLAHRMGIWQFKSELEDISFRYLYPQEYKRLKRKLLTHEERYQEVLEESQRLLKEQLEADQTLQEQASHVKVVGRTKEIYSLWHKMETKHERNLDHIGDVVALRVIITPHHAETMSMEDDQNEDEIWEDETESVNGLLEEVADHDFKSEQSFPRKRRQNRRWRRQERSNTNHADRGVWLCYHVLGLVQHLPGFQPVPTRVKDYISFPKPNGYQSLHTAVMLQGQSIEVQIRTSQMDRVAEYGMASHWAYTDNKRMPNADVYNTPWLSSIKEWQNEGNRISSRDFVESVRQELLGKRVFVFLRNGKILNLARGATAIDAAFQIHTEIGLEMHGVEINGKSVPFSYELRNGDVVSVLSGKGRPSLDWMRYAKSRSTRSKLRSYFRQKQKESLREAGKILLMDYLWMHGPTIEQHRPYLTVPTTVQDIADIFQERLKEHEAVQNSVLQYTDIDEMLIALGKQNDRAMLHTIVAKLFGVPTSVLMQAETSKNRGLLVPASVADAIKQSRRNAKYAAKAVQHNGELSAEELAAKRKPYPQALPEGKVTTMFDNIFETLKGETEYVDPEHLCRHCLPVYGDHIVGTRPSSSQLSADDNILATTDTITMVHRLGCPVAQRALNLASASLSMSNYSVDSVSLRRMAHKRNANQHGSALLIDNVPVKLEWSDDDYNGDEGCGFLTEVVIVAEDRKLLLADCSEVVSEMSEIVKSSSSSSQEHATLVFLVQIDGLHQLQRLMDRLQEIRSVMSVERRFGSELLT